jgi:hypothetical protein
MRPAFGPTSLSDAHVWTALFSVDTQCELLGTGIFTERPIYHNTIDVIWSHCDIWLPILW